jgi:hypothetical protein
MSAVSLPWNIGRTNAVSDPTVLIAVTSVTSARSSRAASFGAKVARLVGVRQEHVRRRQLPDDGLQRGGEAVGRIGLERRVFDGHDFGDLRGSELGPDACSVRPRHEDRDRRT